MPLDPVAALLERIRGGRQWPLESEARIIRRLRTWRAFADSDEETLARALDWPRDRELHIDPLPERIAEGWGDYLFGEELLVTPGNDQDTDRLAQIVEANDLTEEARTALKDLCVPEGEAWWRIVVDRDLADVPLIEWHSRLSFIPYYIGRRLLAAAFVQQLEGPANVQTGRNAVWRQFEIHAPGVVEHRLFRGNDRRLGSERPLEEHSETEDLGRELGESQRWTHGIGLDDGDPNICGLVGRIINRRGRDPRLGRSEYQSIKHALADLNEAMTIAAENARVAAKRRAIIPADQVSAAPDEPWRYRADELVDNGEGQFVPKAGTKPRNKWDGGEEVLVHEQLNAELGREGTPPYQVLEYSYDAEQVIAHKRDLVETAVTRIGMTVQWLGVRASDSGEGLAISGTALRFRLLPQDRSAGGKARQWDNTLPRILRRTAQVDALPEEAGGFAFAWADLETVPTVTRSNALPPDDVEQAQTESALVGAGLRSLETAVRNLNPEQDEDWIGEELARIDADRKARTPPALAPFSAPPPAGGDAGPDLP